MRSASPSEARYVTLRHGPVLPAEVVLLALDLEARGITLARDGDGLLARPRAALTEHDVAAIGRWRLHLLAVVDYCDRPDLGDHLQ
jgi:hypothetical protein